MKNYIENLGFRFTLAKSATHVNWQQTKTKFAFTLAEVLITLGIIGIVAAMTIPTLIANTRARQYTSKFKKTISTLSNAARMSSELYGFDYSGLSVKCTANSAKDNPENKQSVCALLNGTLSGMTYNYGIDKLNNYSVNFTSDFGKMDSMSANNQKKMPIYTLADGTIIAFSLDVGQVSCTNTIGKSPSISSDGNWGTACYGFIDVNGISLPNKEVRCTSGTNKNDAIGPGDCIVSSKDVTDIFPFVIFDGSATPMTSAGWFILNNSK